MTGIHEELSWMGKTRAIRIIEGLNPAERLGPEPES
jgi:hypothetical protein